MPILLCNFITRKMIQENPNALFVFGDNYQRKGFGGQAKEMRGEPNTIGIPTKFSPSMNNSAFLSNRLFVNWLNFSRTDWSTIIHFLNTDRIVVWPSNGLGTGFAKLNEKAPLIQDYINNMLSLFKKYYGETMEFRK